ncbi:MAG: pyridoxamine 5'-phosphate oxidase family protein [Kiritimatiellia bacterium]|jgi:general stress protein 26|nr:pyridoxamine 5'-phosphate oxidase family protein [Pseudomonadales bacterium]MDP7024048.1 pyridoxamine 5'-phosphate oxidase family protein [Kiritimatiellia bacterium]|tara:strand:- start:1889 stop:2494 length:606 start_codon:yes stop_codon:yes gene_type:complete
MSEEKPQVRFDPERLERLNVSTDYPMEQDEFELLYRESAYCSMAHVNKRGYPVVTPMFYVVEDDNMMLSTIKNYRLKVGCLMENPKMSVAVHNDGTNVRHQKAILVMGQAKIHDDDEMMRRIHWKIIDKYFFELTTDEERQVAFEAVHTPLRCIIEVVPEKIMTWDLGKMLEAHDDGVWYGESQKLINKHMTKEHLDLSRS